ncbi:MAG TPA: tripartite tricarboxylate transporter substrate binding protein [Burkholderiales bacterium]|nr:tripartite tricarboxylate transporter substrate binding protein [Burkholderiales bacterium]
MRFWRVLLLGFFFVLNSAAAQYPSKPVRMIIPFAPGGASDFVGRILQPRLSELLGQPVVIENRPGASGNIGLEAGARAAPDGYTVYLGNVGTVAINVSVFPKLPVTPLKDFIAITQVVDVPGALVAHPSFPPNSVKEFVAYAKANPGKVNYASPGSGSQNRLEMENLRKAAGGLDMVHVPYKGGAGPAVSALVAGETQVMFVTASSAMPMVKAGRLKVFALTAAKRSPELPNVPTMDEEGFPGFDSGSWQGIFVPVGTPKEIVDKLFAVTQQTMKAPEVIQRLAKGGVEVVTSASSAEFHQFVARETERWARAVKESGATVD